MESNDQRVFLIVDDEPDMLWALENLLKQQGLVSRRALRGNEALELIAENKFGMAFLDLKLPDMDGLELARRIKAVDPHMKIVLVSGYFYKDEGQVRAAIEEGLICDFISKPFLHEDIRRAIVSGHLETGVNP
jgi:DNA-binding NtrC family response regulator